MDLRKSERGERRSISCGEREARGVDGKRSEGPTEPNDISRDETDEDVETIGSCCELLNGVASDSNAEGDSSERFLFDAVKRGSEVSLVAP